VTVTQSTAVQCLAISDRLVDSPNHSQANRHSMGEAERFRGRVLEGLEVN